jgi:hypothetical protein
VGLESADATTLALLKKPVSAQIVSEAFSKIIDINRRYETIEVTANVVFGGDLPPVHLPSFLELTRHSLGSFYDKGAIYLSPLLDGARGSTERNRKMLKQFNDVKRQSRLPTFLYLIQRL